MKEANKHKSQLGHAAAPCLFPQSPAPPQAHVQQHMPHFLHSQHQLQFHHQPAPQQPSCPQIMSAAHTSAFPLQTCSSGIQPRAHIQTAASVSLAAVPIEVKPCIGVSYNRNFPVNGHYSCITQCFERWWRSFLTFLPYLSNTYCEIYSEYFCFGVLSPPSVM